MFQADSFQHQTSSKVYGPACIEALAHEAKNNVGAPRISAANSLLDRGFGKVGQPIELTGPGGGPVDLTVGISPDVAAMLKFGQPIELTGPGGGPVDLTVDISPDVAAMLKSAAAGIAK